MQTSRDEKKATKKNPLKIIFCHMELHLWFFISWFRVQSFKKITTLPICSMATMHLFHFLASWEQSKKSVYLKHIVKAKRRQFFICVWLSQRGRLSVIAWKVRARLNVSMSKRECLCCCRASQRGSWPPSQVRGRGPGRQQWFRARVSPEGSLCFFSLWTVYGGRIHIDFSKTA